MRPPDLLAAAILGLLSTPAAAQSPPATPATPAANPYPIKRLPFLTWLVDYEPFWSPDGKQIVLISNRHGGMKVHVLAAAAAASDHGAGMRQLTFDEAEDDSPAWSPDGKRIAYVSVRDGVSEIRVMNADGSEQHPVTPPRTESIHPAWSPDGSRVLVNTNAFAAAGKEESPPGASGPPRTIGDATDDAMDLARSGRTAPTSAASRRPAGTRTPLIRPTDGPSSTGGSRGPSRRSGS